MEIKYQVNITSVGKLANEFLENNNSVIILNEGAHPNLSDMVVEHTAADLSADIVEGDRLKIGNADFKVVKVGDIANKTIKEEGHCTLLINAEGSMPGQIIVKGPVPPRLRVSDQIRFFSK